MDLSVIEQKCTEFMALKKKLYLLVTTWNEQRVRCVWCMFESWGKPFPSCYVHCGEQKTWHWLQCVALKRVDLDWNSVPTRKTASCQIRCPCTSFHNMSIFCYVEILPNKIVDSSTYWKPIHYDQLNILFRSCVFTSWGLISPGRRIHVCSAKQGMVGCLKRKELPRSAAHWAVTNNVRIWVYMVPNGRRLESWALFIECCCLQHSFISLSPCFSVYGTLFQNEILHGTHFKRHALHHSCVSVFKIMAWRLGGGINRLLFGGLLDREQQMPKECTGPNLHSFTLTRMLNNAAENK